jgi:hypothetical protein
MSASSQSRTGSSTRSDSTPQPPARTNPRKNDDQQSPNFGTADELISLRTPPSARAIPPQAPSSTLAGRTRESLRIARERQAERAFRTPLSTKSRAKAPVTNRFNATITPSTSKARVQTRSTFNAARERPKTPVTNIRAATPTTPSSPRHSRQTSSIANAASPKTTPHPVRVTSAGSSMAVRDAIIKAKEAQQKVKKTTPAHTKQIDYRDESSFDDISNPFNLSSNTPPLQSQLRRAIEIGRTTGIVPSSHPDARKFEHLQPGIAGNS